MEPAMATPANPSARRLHTWGARGSGALVTLAGLLALFTATLGTAGWFYFQRQQASTRRTALDTLAAIADLKAAEIARWTKERRGDAETSLDKPLARRFLAEQDNAAVREELLQWMKAFQGVHGYSHVVLLDGQGVIRLAVPADAPVADGACAERIRAALRTREVVFVDLHRAQPGKPVHMSWLVPLGVKPKEGQLADGVLLFEIDPWQFLYPLVQDWPTPSRTAETLLVRRDGNDVVFLNELRHRKDTAMEMRQPIVPELRLPAAMAVEGKGGVVEGMDYRGIPVLAALRKIPDTPWFMVAKVDQEEVLAPLRQQARTILLIFALLVLVAVLGAGALWRQQRLEFIRQELTGRLHAEAEARRNREAELKEAQRVANIGDWTWSAGSNSIWWSEQLYRIYGKDPDVPVSDYETDQHNYAPQSAARLTEAVERAMQTGEPYVVELELAPSGSGRWVQARGEVMRDSGGKVIGLRGTVQDITERRRAEEALHEARLELERRVRERTAELLEANRALQAEIAEREQAEKALRESDERFRRIFLEHDAIMLLIAPKTGAIRDANPAAALFYGYPTDQLLKMTIQEINTMPAEDVARERARAREMKQNYFVFPHRLASGEIRTVEVHSSPVSIQNEVLLFSIIHDITARQRADEELRAAQSETARLLKAAEDSRRALLGVVEDQQEAEERMKRSREFLDRILNTIGDPVFVKNEQLEFLLVNDALCALLGKAREEIIGTTGMEFLPPDEADHFLRVDREVLSSGEVNVRKGTLTRHDGRVRTVLTKVTRYVDGQRAKFVVGTIHDITDHEELEEQLRMAQKMEAIGSLAGGVAHDFNNILAVILSYTGFAMEALREGDPLRDDLAEVKKAGERATALTRQLLAFSRKQILQPVPLNLNQIAAGLEKMLRRIVGEDIEYVHVLAPDLGVVRADPGQLEQVLMNLVINARDAMPGGGMLTIETANAEIDEEYATRRVAVKPGSYVQLAVTDTGTGMDEQTRARLFEPFFTTKAKGKGTGLGLSTVYGIVKQSGGHIWIYSKPGQGTTFKIYLPRVPGAAETVTQTHVAVTGATGTETILVAEDEDALRKVVKRSLMAAGYAVLTAADGIEALATAAQHAGEIQLLLTDVVMPRMSGRVLAQEIVKVRPATKVLYMSGYTDNAIVHHGVLDAGTQFIAKPFTAAALTQKVRDVLGGSATGLQYGPEPTAMAGGLPGNEFVETAGGTAPDIATAPPRQTVARDRRILLVDDDDALLFLEKRILSRLGYKITAFSDPLLALAEFRERPGDFDWVISDISMPGLSGFDLARELLAKRPEIPIVLTSGCIRPEDEDAARKTGVRAIILKRDSVEDMAAPLEKIFRAAGKGEEPN